jgi:hypothetical protein
MSFKLARLNNAAAVDTAGFEKLISTQEEIVAGVIETKYYQLLGQTLADFVPFDVGRGAYSTSIFQYTSAYVGSPFEAGLVQPSEGLGINAKANIVIDGLSIKNNFWRMDYEVSHEIIEMGKVGVQAFSIIEEKEKARKKIYDLGMQDVTFNGLPNVAGVYGLLNQPTATINTSLFAKDLPSMSATELSAFVGSAVSTYLANNNSTQLFNRMIIPTSDFVALGVPSNPDYPLKTKLQVIEDAFKAAGIADFKILHSKYNETASTTGSKRYVIYNKDADSIRMYIPKQYTPHALYPMNGIDFVSVAEAQFTGVQLLRPLEFLYADLTPNL